MNVAKKDLTKSQVELTVELSLDEFNPYIARGVEKVSKEVKIEGFRPGKVPYEILKQKIGEMTILEEAADIAVRKTIADVIKNNGLDKFVGQPQINIIKLAPGNPFEYKIILALVPEIKLGDYKNAKVKLEKVEVKNEEVESMIKKLLEMGVKEKKADRETREGDKIIIDLEMFLDKVPVEGGQGKDTAVVIGKDYIIPGFDKKIIGAKKSEIREFSLVYPAEHYLKNLAGKRVEFKVFIKEIYEREWPEVNDDFAVKFGLKNAEELKDNIKKSILSEKSVINEQKAEIAVLNKIIEKTKFNDIPEILINEEVEAMVHELKYSIESQGGKFEDYLLSIKKTRDQIILDLLPEAVKRIKSALIIREIEKLEAIKVGEEEVEKEIKKLKEQYKNNPEIKNRIASPDYRIHLFSIMANKKVVEKLKEWNIEK
jgi:trigger factor